MMQKAARRKAAEAPLVSTSFVSPETNSLLPRLILLAFTLIMEGGGKQSIVVVDLLIYTNVWMASDDNHGSIGFNWGSYMNLQSRTSTTKYTFKYEAGIQYKYRTTLSATQCVIKLLQTPRKQWSTCTLVVVITCSHFNKNINYVYFISQIFNLTRVLRFELIAFGFFMYKMSGFFT